MEIFRKYCSLELFGRKILAIPSLITYSSPSDYGWIINVKKAVLNEHQKEPFDIIHSRLNPHSSHQVALSIKKNIPKYLGALTLVTLAAS